MTDLTNLVFPHDEPVRCRVITPDIEVHWFVKPLHVDRCMCGKTERRAEESS